MQQSKADKQYEALMDVFRKTNADGTYYYTDAEVRHWLPILYVTSDLKPAQWTPDMTRIFDEFMSQAGIKAEGDDRAWPKMLRYYEKNPVSRELEQDLRGFLMHMKLDNQDAMRRKVTSTLSSLQGGRTTTPALAAPKLGGAMRPLARR